MIQRRKINNAKVMIALSAAPSKAGIAELETLIKRCSKMYYDNSRFLRVNVVAKYPAATKMLGKLGVDVDAGVETIDDATFDLLWDVLGEVAPNSAVLKKTGTAIKGSTQAKLPYAMNGLNQVRPDTVDEWLKKNPGPYVVSDKLDGVSLETVHKKAGTLDAYTKGDSDMGNRVTGMVDRMKVPKLRLDVAVRSEMIMKAKTFDVKHSRITSKGEGKKYENARNMVAGATNPKRKDHHAALHDIDVVAYELLNPRKKPSDQFKFLKKMGYNVAPYKVFKTLSSAKLVEYLRERRKVSHYEMDGLVIAQDKVYPIATGESPAKHMVKFKYNDDDAIVEVKVKGVEWEHTKHDKIMPRVNIPPTRLAGVTVDFATGHNAFYILHGYAKKDAKKGLPERPIGPGATIRITRSGDVIPYIVEVLKGARKAAMPDEAFKWGKNGTHIFTTKTSQLSEVKRITYFFSKLDVEGLKIGTVQKLFDVGLNSILKIVKAKKTDFLKAEGVKDKTASKLVANMKIALDKMTLPALMDASGLFGQGMGEKRCSWVLKKFPGILTTRSGIAPSKTTLVAQLLTVKGFSNTLAQQFADGLPKFIKFYAKLGIKAQEVKPVRSKGKAFANKIVVWTGFRNAAQELIVEEQGGTVGSGVSSKTSILVVKDASFTSTKVDKARAAGITILTNAKMQAMIDKLK